MSVGVSGAPEFLSAYSSETPSLHFYGSASSSVFPKSLTAGRPSPTPRGGRDLAVFLGLCSDMNRTKAVSYISKCCQSISAMAASLLSCKVEKMSISRKFGILPAITGSNVDIDAVS